MRRSLVFLGTTVIIGFMIAIQFHTTQEPDVRDKRDIWELRRDLEKEKQVQQKLNNEIWKYEKLVDKYRSNKEGQIKTLKATLKDLKKEAGLTEVSGHGIILTVEPLLDDKMLVGKPAGTIQPELMRRLINELNTYGAQEVSIDGERIVSTTPIREVNGKTYINDQPISPVPIKIKVISNNSNKLNIEMLSSQSSEDFARENLLLKSTLADKVTLPAYEHPIRVQYMKQKEEN